MKTMRIMAVIGATMLANVSFGEFVARHVRYVGQPAFQWRDATTMNVSNSVQGVVDVYCNGIEAPTTNWARQNVGAGDDVSLNEATPPAVGYDGLTFYTSNLFYGQVAGVLECETTGTWCYGLYRCFSALAVTQAAYYVDGNAAGLYNPPPEFTNFTAGYVCSTINPAYGMMKHDVTPCTYYPAGGGNIVSGSVNTVTAGANNVLSNGVVMVYYRTNAAAPWTALGSFGISGNGDFTGTFATACYQVMVGMRASAATLPNSLVGQGPLSPTEGSRPGFVDITNTATSVSYAITTFAVAGTNTLIVGGMLVSNATVGGAATPFAAATSWTAPAVALAVGVNTIAVYGTNTAGAVASDTVAITRMPPSAMPTNVVQMMQAVASIQANSPVAFRTHSWSNGSAQVGYGVTTDGSGWTWVAAVLSNGVSPYVATNMIAFPVTGTYYYGAMWVVDGRTNYGWNSAGQTNAASLGTAEYGIVVVAGIPDCPNAVAATDGAYTNKVAVTWNASSGATKYAVWRNTTAVTNGAANISGDVTATNYNDTAVVPGTSYWYWVKAGNSNGWSGFGACDGGHAAFPLYGWSNRVKVTFAGYTNTETLVDFPALVVLNAGCTGFAYAQCASAAGNDIRFTDAGGVGLDFEIEEWNTNGNSYLWVKVPELKATSTYVWLYFGNPAAAAPACTTNGATWTASYLSVHHLSTNGTDATWVVDAAAMRGAGQWGSLANMEASDWTEGKIARCLAFNTGAGENDELVSLQDGYSNFPAGVTLSAWVKKHTEGGPGVYCPFVRLDDSDYIWWGEAEGSAYIEFTGSGQYGASGDYPSGQWIHTVATLTTGEAGTCVLTLYRNGEVAASNGGWTMPGAKVRTGNTLGADLWGSYLYGSMDEVEVAGIARSPAWIWATYQNQDDPQAFATFTPSASGPLAIASACATQVQQTSATVQGTVTGDDRNGVHGQGSAMGTTPDPVGNREGVTGHWEAAFVISRTRTGLESGTYYYARVYASNEVSGIKWSSNIYFCTEPLAATGLSASNMTSRTMLLAWNVGNACAGTLVAMSQGTNGAALPADGANYTGNALFGSGTEIGGGTYAVHAGAGTTVVVSNLLAGTWYSVGVYSYAGTGSVVNYVHGDAPTGSVRTAAAEACVDITNGAATVANTVTEYRLGGTNNIYTVGRIVWTNSLGGNGSVPASATGWAFTVSLTVGTNTIAVYGTNAVGVAASDAIAVTRLDVGTGAPFVAVTNGPTTVPNDTLAYAVSGTNNMQVIGGMWVSNATMGDASTSFAGGGSWSAPALALAVGPNTIRVYGTNAYGTVTNDSVVITRGVAGTGTPFVDVTNTPVTVADDVTTCTIGGTNNGQVVGAMRWTNWLTGASASFTNYDVGFAIFGIPLGVGSNSVTVTGTNMLGTVTSDSVTVVRLAPLPITNGVWTSLTGGSWTNTACWQGGRIANGTNMLADISTLNITIYPTITLDKDRTIGHIKTADTIASRDWTLDAGTPAGILTLAVSSGVPTVNVVNRMLAVYAEIAGSSGLCKSGAGTLELYMPSTYAGPTVVSNGVLALYDVDALAGSSGLNVTTGGVCDATGLLDVLVLGSGQALRGGGTIYGDIEADDMVMPGDAIGTLTVEGTLMLGGTATTTIELNRSLSPSSDKLVVNGTITCGGALVVTNLGAELQVGDSFDVLDATAVDGTFSTCGFPALTAGKLWNTNNLYVTGLISVGSTETVQSNVVRMLYAVPATTAYATVYFLSSSQSNGTGRATVGTTATCVGYTNMALIAQPFSNGLYWACTSVLQMTETGRFYYACYWIVGGVTNYGWNENGQTNEYALTQGEYYLDVYYAPDIAVGVAASDGSYTNKVAVAWTAASNATKYTVWRNTADTTNGATDISGETAATSHDDTTAVAGSTYWYWVRAGNPGAWGGFSASDSGFRDHPFKPFVNVTNAAVTVPNDMLTYAVGGTNNAQVVVGMWVSNATVGGASTSFAGGGSWTAPAMGLGVGPNTIRVYGTNVYGVATNDSVVITRGLPGTGTPFVDVTNTAMTVAEEIETCTVGGTNNAQVVGWMRWSNELTGTSASFTNYDVRFTISGIPIAVGTNTITVIGTNMYGTISSDSVAVTRLVPLPSTNGVWTSASGGSWTNAACWQGGAIANGADMVADISTLNLGSHAAITLDKNRTIGHVKTADTLPSRDWTLEAGTPAGILRLTVSSGMPTINVVNRMLAVYAEIAGSNGLCKTGAGTLELCVANTYGGATVVSNGTLSLSDVDAIAGSSALNVTAGGVCDAMGLFDVLVLGSGQTLRGGGTLYGDIEANGAVMPGDAIGTLLVEGTLGLGGTATTTIELNRSLSPSSDKLSVNGTLTCGGTLIVTNTGSGLQDGDLFDLMDGTISGAFGTVSLPWLGTGKLWYTNNLYTTGEIAVRSLPGYGAPYVDVTNAAATVANDVTTWTVGGTNNVHVVGWQRWSNELTGANGSFTNASLGFAIPGIALAVGTNTIMVTATNILGVVTNDSVAIVRGPVGTGMPFIDVTNTAAMVPHDVLSVTVRGTNNIQVMGGMWVSNATVGGAAMSFAAAASWTAPALMLAVGSNMVVVAGTNVYGTVTNDTVVVVRGAVGTGTPYVDVTNAPVFVPNDVGTYAVAGTNNPQVVGTMHVTNVSAGGARATFAAAESWSAPAVALGVGANTLVVVGTNAYGVATNDSMVVTRGAVGTGTPFLDVTNTAMWVGNDVGYCTIGGTNSGQVVGWMRWSNVLTGAGASFTNYNTGFVISGIALAVGDNLIVVAGTNAYGVITNDTVTITRGPVGTGTPHVDITNTPGTVLFTVTNCVVAGTNNQHVVGWLRWTNGLNGSCGSVAVTGDRFQVTAIPLAVGTNTITVSGTNVLGILSWDSVVAERLVAPPAAPTGVAATDGTYTNKVGVTWTAAASATVYAVYRNTVEVPEGAENISGEIGVTAFDDTSAVPGQTYVYWVKAANAGGWSGWSAGDAGHAGVNVALPTFAPSVLNFSSNLATLFVTLGNEGTVPYTYSTTVTTGGAWLAVNPAGGIVSNHDVAVAFEVNRTCLVDGAYTGSVSITTSAGTGAVVTVRLAVVGNLVAEANGPYVVNQGSPVTFIAAGSKGAAAQYRWRVGTNAWSAYSTNYATYVYTNTLVPEDLDVVLGVRNTNTPPNETTDNATLSIKNVAPVVDIGGPYQASNLVAVPFVATVTDPGKLDVMEYRWDFDGNSMWDTGWLGSNKTSHAYTTGGSYTVQCEVRDNRGGIGLDTAAALIMMSNVAPVVSAVVYGTTLTLTNLPGLGFSVTLSGAGSFDPDNKPLTNLYFDWREDVANPQKPVTAEADRHNPVLTTQPLTQPGVYLFHLVVFDGQYNSKEATVTVRVPGWRGEAICEGFLAKVPLWGVEAVVTNAYTGQMSKGRSNTEGWFLADAGRGYQIARLNRRELTNDVSVIIDEDGITTESIYFRPYYYIYAGQVVTGTPGRYVGLLGAQVEVTIGNGLSTATDLNGQFGFGAVPESWPVDGAPYTVRVQKSGFKSKVMDLMLTMHRNSEVVLLEPLVGTSVVSGTVLMLLNANGALRTVSYATVKFGNNSVAVTDTRGAFGPISLPEGEYSVTLEKEGYEKTILQKVLVSGATNLTMRIGTGVGSVYGSTTTTSGGVVTNATVSQSIDGTLASARKAGRGAMFGAAGVLKATMAGYYDLGVAKGNPAVFYVSAPGFERHHFDGDVDCFLKHDVVMVPEQPPQVGITNAPGWLQNDTTEYFLCGTNNAHAEGTMWWSNLTAQTGGSITRDGSLGWSGTVGIVHASTTMVNVVRVYATNWWDGAAYGEACIVVGEAGTGVPYVDTTNGPIAVASNVASCVVAGTNNLHVMGGMWVTNATAGGAAQPFAAAASWIAPAIGLVYGENSIEVHGTNLLGEETFDTVPVTRGIVGYLPPFVDATNGPATVVNDIATFAVAGTNNEEVVGAMTVTNETAGGVALAFAATRGWAAPSIALAVGANTLRVRGTNVFGDVSDDTVVVTRLGAGTGTPFVDVTNASPIMVGASVEAVIVAGTNNMQVVGGLRWTNSLNGAVGAAAAGGAGFMIANVVVAEGTNTIIVFGTNMYGDVADDSIQVIRGGAGTGLPFVDATNTMLTVANDVETFVMAGTNNVHVMGGMVATNVSAGGVAKRFAASSSWVAPAVSLVVGTNTIVVEGTNAWGTATNDTIIVTRGQTGTGTPFVDITNMVVSLGNHMTAWTVAGTNNAQVVGWLRWTNEFNGAAGVYAVNGSAFQVSGIPLTAGTNTIAVRGTNVYGTVSSDSVAVFREYPGTNGVWSNDNGGSWTNTGNWVSNIVASGKNGVADISTLNINNPRTITLDGSRTIGHIIVGDSVLANKDWTLDAGFPAGTLKLSVSIGTPTINVVNQTLVVWAAVEGSDGLCKAGAGTLKLEAANIFSGPTTVSNGTLAVTSGSALGQSWRIEVVAGAAFDVSGAGSFNIGAAQMLRGRGIVVGNINISGTNAPGSDTFMGTLTVSGNVSLVGTPVTMMRINPGAATNADLLAVAGSLSIAGKLKVDNVGGEPAPGTSFNLFDATMIAGTFVSIELPSPGSGKVWITNALYTTGVISVDNVRSPADVEQFMVGRGTDYGQVQLAWSNYTVVVLACTNRTYSSNPADWFVLASNVAAPWTHSTASNYPSTYYRVVSGTFTSRYDVGKFDIDIAAGSIAWLSFPFGVQIGCDVLSEWFGQQLEPRAFSAFNFPSLQKQASPGGTIENSDYYADTGVTNWVPDRTVAANAGYVLFLPPDHGPVKVTGIGMVQTNNVSMLVPYNSVPWVSLAYPVSLDMRQCGLTNILQPPRLYSSFDYDYIDSQQTPGGPLWYAEYYKDDWGGGSVNFFPSMTGADKLEPGKSYLLFFGTTRTGTGVWTCVKPY